MYKGSFNMDKAKNVLKYYVFCNTLKDVVRTGWKDWNVNRERLESIAEHIYGVSDVGNSNEKRIRL